MNSSCVMASEVSVASDRATTRRLPVAQSADQKYLLQRVRELMHQCLQEVNPGPARSASEYQINSRGSLLRARLALISGAAFNCTLDYRIAAAAACELVHNASLVHDDLCDGDEIRRNQATVWKHYDKGVALCSGDLLLCAAFNAACRVPDAGESRELVRLLTAATSEAIVGQSLEIALPETSGIPRLRQYLQVTRAKTVPLIQMSLLSGAIAGQADARTQQLICGLADAIGLAYQILDDLDDLPAPVPKLHRYHAWHYHRVPGRASGHIRIERAVRHAMAALQRARSRLTTLTAITPHAPDHQLITLIEKLHAKALAHRHANDHRESTANVSATLNL